MAIVNFASTVDGILGSVGGVTYSAGASGPYLYARKVGPRRSSVRQNAQRGVFSATAPGWAALSSTQRDAWNAWALEPEQEFVNRLGVLSRLLGWQWYARINMRLESAGRAWLDDPPVDPRPADATVGSVTAEISGGVPAVVVAWDGAEFPSGTDLVVYALQGWSASRTVPPRFGALQFAGVAPGSDDLDITDGLAAVFGPLAAGQAVWAWIARQSDEGQRSGWLLASTVAVVV